MESGFYIMLIDLPRVARLNRPKTLPPIRPTMALKADLASAYRPITDVWAKAIPDIMAAYDPAPITLDTAPEAEDAISTTARIAQFLAISLTPRIGNLAVRVVEWHKAKFAQYALTATGVELGTILQGAQSGDTVATFLARNVALVKSVSDDVQAKIADRVFRGFQERAPAREVAKDLAKIVDGGRKRGLRIASDQMQKLSAQLDTERMIDVGIKRWKWRHSGKRFPREIHKARDGKIYSFTNQPDDLPGFLPFCGCVRQALLPAYSELD